MLLGKEGQARRNLCIALDVEDVHDALKLAKATSEFVGYFKINRVFLQAADAGFSLISRLEEIKPKEEGSVIVDLKWHDSPGTVHGYSKDVSRMFGVSMFTIHIEGERKCVMQLLREQKTQQKSTKDKGLEKTEYMLKEDPE